jgi:hypothetical protein
MPVSTAGHVARARYISLSCHQQWRMQQPGCSWHMLHMHRMCICSQQLAWEGAGRAAAGWAAAARGEGCGISAQATMSAQHSTAALLVQQRSGWPLWRGVQHVLAEWRHPAVLLRCTALLPDCPHCTSLRQLIRRHTRQWPPAGSLPGRGRRGWRRQGRRRRRWRAAGKVTMYRLSTLHQ